MGLLSSCNARDSHCSGFAYCRPQALRCLGFRSCSSWTLEHRLHSCGTQASLLHGMWHSPGPGIKPMSLGSAASGFFTTELPGTPYLSLTVWALIAVQGLLYLWYVGTAALWHAGSSFSWQGSHILCIGRQIFTHWTTREVPVIYFL